MEYVNVLEKKLLDDLIGSKNLVSIFLKNGIKLTGHIIEVDNDVIILQATITLLIYKDAISSITLQVDAVEISVRSDRVKNKITKKKIIV